MDSSQARPRRRRRDPARPLSAYDAENPVVAFRTRRRVKELIEAASELVDRIDGRKPEKSEIARIVILSVFDETRWAEMMALRGQRPVALFLNELIEAGIAALKARAR